MPNINNDLFALIKTLTSEEKAHVLLTAFPYKKRGDNGLMTLFKLLDKQEIYNPEALKGVINNLSNRKIELRNNILFALHNRRSEMPEVTVRRDLDFIQILMDKQLFEQAHELLIKVKHWCDNYYRLDYKSVALQYERKISMYINQSDIRGHYKQIREQVLANAQESFLLARIYDFYMRIMELEVGYRPTMRKEASFQTDISLIMEDPIFSMPSEGMSLPVLTYFTKAKMSVYFYKKDYNKCYELGNPVFEIYRSKKNKTYYEIQIYRIWLMNTMGLHANALNFEAWKTALEEMALLIDSDFKKDIVTNCFYQHFRLLYHYELDQFKSDGRVIAEAAAFLKKQTKHIPQSALIHFEYDLTSMLLDIGRPDDAWIYCHHLLNSDIELPGLDVEEYLKILFLFILLEKKEYSQLAHHLRLYASHVYQQNANDYIFDKLAICFLQKMVTCPDERLKQKKNYTWFHDEIKSLLQKKHYHTREVCNSFDFEKWSLRKANEQYRNAQQHIQRVV